MWQQDSLIVITKWRERDEGFTDSAGQDIENWHMEKHVCVPETEAPTSQNERTQRVSYN